jgi:hypothetical protein
MNNNSPYILPAELIASLYKDILIDDQEVQKDEKNGQHVEPKNTLVLVNHTDSKLNEKQSAFLSAILKACKMELHEVNLMCCKSSNCPPYQDLASTLSPKNIIAFGLTPTDIGLPMLFPTFQIQSFENIKYTIAPLLEEIELDKSLKMKLWGTLQQLF